MQRAERTTPELVARTRAQRSLLGWYLRSRPLGLELSHRTRLSAGYMIDLLRDEALRLELECMGYYLQARAVQPAL